MAANALTEIIEDPVKLKISGRGPYNLNIHFFKFDKDSITDITSVAFKEFIKNFKAEEDKNIFYTNGANKQFKPEGGGTTYAINTIFGDKAWTNNLSKIYEPSIKDDLKDLALIEDSEQKWNSDYINNYNAKITEEKDNLPTNAGSVIKYSHNDNSGVYHINGIDWGSVTDKSTQSKYSKLSKQYYFSIIKDFIENTDATVLVLSQIPGYLFRGGDEVYKGMLEAIESASNTPITKQKYDENPTRIEREMNLLLDIEKDKYDEIINEINST